MDVYATWQKMSQGDIAVPSTEDRRMVGVKGHTVQIGSSDIPSHG